jgi:hypothetical protein
MSVSCECCVMSVLPSVVCLMCVTMKPRRNEEAQAPYKAVEPYTHKKKTLFLCYTNIAYGRAQVQTALRTLNLSIIGREESGTGPFYCRGNDTRSLRSDRKPCGPQIRSGNSKKKRRGYCVRADTRTIVPWSWDI